MLIKKITPTCLSAIKKKFSLTHIVMWCMSEEGQYIITTGNTPDNIIQASVLGNKLKVHFGWPKMSFAIAPKISEAMVEIQKLKEENRRLKKLLNIKSNDNDNNNGDMKTNEGNEIESEPEEESVC